jgi:thioredoxin 1
MKALACFILYFAPLAIVSGGQADAPVSGKVTLVYFWAAWCGPCRVVTPAMQQMADTDADIARRKIDLTDARSEESYGVTALRHVKVYNRGGSLVGTVTGADIGKIKSYVTEAKGG